MKSIPLLFCLSLIIITTVIIRPISPATIAHQDGLEITNSDLMVQTPAQEIGHTRSFWAVDYDRDVYYIIDAKLYAVGNHCYIYFENSVVSRVGEEETNGRAEFYRDEFETSIYPKVTELLGNPNGTLGDIDGDPRIFILIMEHRMSCYRQSNEVEGPHSNMCEMVYICYRSGSVLETIAHEFGHLVWFNYEFDEVHFILEGVAEYATYYAGYVPDDNCSVRTADFLNNIHDSFIYFEVEAQDYGACYLFAFYLAEQYGTQFLSDLVQNDDDGAFGLETALDGAGFSISFNELYLDWMTAITIDEQGFADDRYCLRDMDATINDYTIVDSLPFKNDNVPLYLYGSKVHRISSPPDAFSVEMSRLGDGVAGLSVAYRDNFGWHVKQMQDAEMAVINVSGESLVTAYIVASYLLSEATTGNIDFGSGPLETAQIYIYEVQVPSDSSGPTPASNNQELLILTGGLSVVLVIVVLPLIIRMERWRRGHNLATGGS
ncbi:MAG: hypothetical protein ACFFEF_12030 [Candidatus Thorarchaeota archaeon]